MTTIRLDLEDGDQMNQPKKAPPTRAIRAAAAAGTICGQIMALEEELQAERSLCDKLASALEKYRDENASVGFAEQALVEYQEARKGTT